MPDPEARGCIYHNDLNALVAVLKNQVNTETGRLDHMEQRQDQLTADVAAVCTDMKVAAASAKSSADSASRTAKFWVPIIVAVITLAGTLTNVLLNHAGLVGTVATAAAKQ